MRYDRDVSPGRWIAALSLVAALAACSFDSGGSDPGGDDDDNDDDVGERSAGCGNGEAATGVMTERIDAAGIERDVLLAVPQDYDAERPYALVFGWHGMGSSSAQARLYFGVEERSDGAAIVVYPQGLPDANGATGWDLAPAGADFALFDALIDDVTARYCIDLRRVYSTGHSFGAWMTNSLGCNRADVLAAIAPVAGGGPIGDCPTGPVAAWIAHGTMDSIVPYGFGEGSRDAWRDHNGCGASDSPVEPEPCVALDDCSDAAVIWCAHEIPDFFGHTWPPFAPAAIWEFFAAQAR